MIWQLGSFVVVFQTITFSWVEKKLLFSFEIYGWRTQNQSKHNEYNAYSPNVWLQARRIHPLLNPRLNLAEAIIVFIKDIYGRWSSIAKQRKKFDCKREYVGDMRLSRSLPCKLHPEIEALGQVMKIVQNISFWSWETQKINANSIPWLALVCMQEFLQTLLLQQWPAEGFIMIEFSSSLDKSLAVSV